jgi:non-homologous end joining protein Ku
LAALEGFEPVCVDFEPVCWHHLQANKSRQHQSSGAISTGARWVRSPYEVRDAKDYFSEIPALPIAADMLELAERILDSKAAALNPANFRDRYEEALIAHLKARQAGAVRPPSEALPASRRAINLMEALRRCIAQDPKPGTTRKPCRRGNRRERHASMPRLSARPVLIHRAT